MTLRVFFISLAVLGLGACEQKPTQTSETKKKVGSAVLATVNSDPITQQDVDFMITRTFSDAEKAIASQEMQRNVLQSLIASKAMQKLMQQELSKEQIKIIENKTKAYQEELYVKEYLLKNATPKPISSKMVQSYYERNLDEFGGGESTSIELLKTAAKPSENQRNTILSSVEKLKTQSNWADFAKNNTDLGLQFFRSKIQPGLFDPAIEQAVKSLDAGDVSGVVFVKQIPHIVKVLDKQKNAAKPLSTVSSAIRKKLAAIELKKAIKTATDDVVKKVDVSIQ